jgi:hypothetical protein
MPNYGEEDYKGFLGIPGAPSWEDLAQLGVNYGLGKASEKSPAEAGREYGEM